ncbi:MAG TPA: GNAT family N-acetyltransferase [Solirubrobacteraceae bacterium]|nr:GNAT family N-acetyltransferase [Solirubrobacteraceae bacterium]
MTSSTAAPVDPTSAPAAPYPSAHVVDVALRDGSSLHIRPVRPDDGDAIHAFLYALSPETVDLRFFGAPNLEWVANWSIDVDYRDRYALVATAGPDAQIVAHGAYIRVSPHRAEVAFMVADSWQGKGIATVMLAHLAAAAAEHDIAAFIAEVLPYNAPMLDVFAESGFPMSRHAKDELVEIELPTALSPQARARLEERDQTAAVAALRAFLAPRSIAVIGASRRRRTVGWEILRNLRSGPFAGTLHVVNPNARTVQGLRTRAHIADVPEPVDLAVIAVPAPIVADVARECAAAGVRALLVISAGFAETGAEGIVRQHELLSICRESGMRLIGPNCLGLLNTAPDVRLDATFAEHVPTAGHVGFLSQSGGLGVAIIEAAERLGLGLSTFVSIGNKADISGNDLLQYWEHDPRTDVILLYLESFGNPRRFARIARRVSAQKPIVAVKSGRSAAGARGGASHTGALVSASDVTVDALFAQAGVIRTDTMHELFDVASLLCAQPVPAGDRVAVVTNAGGPGILCADACQAEGLDVAELPAPVRARLARFLSPEAGLGNPVDMIATCPASHYLTTIETLVDHHTCDAIIAIFVPPLVTRPRDVAREVRAAAAHANAQGVALLAVFMEAEHAGLRELRAHGHAHLPVFDFPEDAARSLAHAVRYGRWRQRPQGAVPALAGLRHAQARAIVADALAAGGGWLGPAEVAELLSCYGLPIVPTRVVSGPAQAVRAAAELDCPVALKAVAPGLLHKSDAGGVLLGLEGADAVRAAARKIDRSVRAAGHELQGLIVQPMAHEGIELLMGVVHDQSFGPVLACGAGGTRAELLRDVAVRITPLTDLDAREMLRSLRTFPLLEGYRGAPPCDVAAAEDALLRLSALVEAHPEVTELDANPVLVSPAGATILDARIRLADAPPRRPQPSLG